MSRSPMQQAIGHCLSTPERQPDGTYRCFLKFPASFIGFDGHFPDQPVVPAVCLISAVELLAQICTGIPTLHIQGIHLAKFRFPVLPDSSIEVKAKITHPDNYRIAAELCLDQQSTSQVTLILGEAAMDSDTKLPASSAI